MDLEVLKSYLVSLGFEAKQSEFAKAEATLKKLGSSVAKTTAEMTKGFTGFAAAVTGAYTSLATATVGLMDKVAQSDLGYQVYAMHMFMSVDAARKLKVATDALGYSLDDIAWNTELRERFQGLWHDQQQMEKSFGKDYAGNMKYLRDIRNEFTRMKVEAQYLAMAVTQSLFKGLGIGGSDLLTKLQKFNDWVIHDLPQIADRIAQSLGPVLRDTWQLLEDIAKAFIHIVGEFSGDDKLKDGSASFENMAAAIGHVNDGLDDVVKKLDKVVTYVSQHPVLARMLGGAAVGAMVGGPTGAMVGAAAGGAEGIAQKAPGNDSTGKTKLGYGAAGGVVTGAAIGSVVPGVGTAIGALLGALGGTWLSGNIPNRWVEGSRNPDRPTRNPDRPTRADIDPATYAKDAGISADNVAMELSRRTGIRAPLIWAWFEHETGGFSNRGTVELNNLAGIKNPGGIGYRKFASIEDFTDYAEKLIKTRYPKALGAQTSEQLAAGLKQGTIGSWYEDTYDHYNRGIQHGLDLLYRHGQIDARTTVGDIHVNVTEPNATAQQIGDAVKQAIDDQRTSFRDGLGKQIQRNIAQVRGPFDIVPAH